MEWSPIGRFLVHLSERCRAGNFDSGRSILCRDTKRCVSRIIAVEIPLPVDGHSLRAVLHRNSLFRDIKVVDIIFPVGAVERELERNIARVLDAVIEGIHRIDLGKVLDFHIELAARARSNQVGLDIRFSVGTVGVHDGVEQVERHLRAAVCRRHVDIVYLKVPFGNGSRIVGRNTGRVFCQRTAGNAGNAKSQTEYQCYNFVFFVILVVRILHVFRGSYQSNVLIHMYRTSSSLR